MTPILKFVFAALICTNIEDISAKPERCNYCESQVISDCLPPKSSHSGCSISYNQCISAAVLLTDSETKATHPLFLRSCWRGGCEELENQKDEVLYCKTCDDKDDCNDDTLPDKDDISPTPAFMNDESKEFNFN